MFVFIKKNVRMKYLGYIFRSPAGNVWTRRQNPWKNQANNEERREIHFYIQKCFECLFLMNRHSLHEEGFLSFGVQSYVLQFAIRKCKD